jgi:hypothetical protein
MFPGSALTGHQHTGQVNLQPGQCLQCSDVAAVPATP